MHVKNVGQKMYENARHLFPINRSLSGEGVRETLRYLQGIVSELVINGVSANTKAFDWTVPKEWHVKDAYIIDPEGKKICDFKNCNLHLMGYSTPPNMGIHLSQL